MRFTKQALRVCEQTIQRGGVIVFPTDTVYGVGCNAFSHDGIEKIYRLKGRSYSKPLPVLLAHAHQLPLVAKDVPAETAVLIDEYWPGPLTLVLKTSQFALNASRGKPTIAVRVPDHRLVRELLNAVQVPLATTSANKSGHDSLSRAADVKKIFMNKVDVIVDGGDCPGGVASSVIDATHVPFTVFREGAISKAELIRVLKLG